ncbi:hypothetical protein [Alteromonas sp. a30]|uniref:hypothetical protein n=1 Tax=Alteromonas sp. a30 TaxID=2730917 RepID=UPI002281E539|nr:hypothetical protein [Alteromonas sp. a30]MCY7294837.1 hypothetical protein [Alteromonas sp. a30]
MFIPTPSLGFSLAEPALSALHKHIPNAKTIGQGRMTYLFWDVYDAELIAPNAEYRKGERFALKLTYLRSLQGKDIAQRSIKEIREQGFNNERALDTWYQKMLDIFPDVENGYFLLGIVDENQHSHFYSAQGHLGSINDPIFSQHFFDIWLAESTSAPKVRKQLLENNRINK